MPLTIKEFDKLEKEFLSTKDDGIKEEWYATPLEIAEHTFAGLRDYLFKDEIDKEARRLQYEELKKEFEPKLTAARSSPVRKTTRMKS